MLLSRSQSILEIDEILRTLLRYCDKTTLACLSRTARFFSDPALDVLWENLESFAHLLRIFPPELISWNHPQQQQVVPTGPPKPTVNHLIVPRDWKRFILYARRVRTWGPEDLSYIEEPLVDHIAFGREPDYILPRLQHMEVTAATVSGVHLQTLMLCPALKSMLIWNSDLNVWAMCLMNTFFRTLADRAPKLNRLIVHWGDGSAVTAQFIEGLLDVFLANESGSSSELKSVNLWTPNCIDAQGFSRLAQLPKLTTLHLNLIGNTHQLVSQIQDTSTAFIALENLFLAGEMEGFTKVLQCFGNAPSMMSLGFSVREYPKSRDLTQLFEAVTAKFPRALRLLQFNVPKQEINIQLTNRLYHADLEAYAHDMSLLRPLLSMRQLTAMHLELGVLLYLTDVDLCTLGAAWPQIEVVNLCSDPYCERAATIVGLIAITEACPSLQHLGLFLDCASGAISEGMIAGSSVASHTLINLDVGRSCMLNPPLVAALLSGVFPNLKVFQWAGMDMPESSLEAGSLQEEYSPGWRQVFDLLPVFRAVRANEQRQRTPPYSSYASSSYLTDGKVLVAVD
ncbi:hypothetical protein J3R30DRAFT_3782075 [Lentinula aciculospora]|uniref:F-box domain-containing protein n=1 Tax=Lentinula aciculospora TaxID=153920 RepID=A0A9W9DJR7_9AGAR|nr:hypothetical protein J3R30DRAFT_3782075 [Lentinula aciculospora]